MDRVHVVSSDPNAADSLRASLASSEELTQGRMVPRSQLDAPDWLVLDLRRGKDARDGIREEPYLWGRFVVHGELGHGAFGRVLEAFDTERRREVALKLPAHQALEDPQTNARFLREVFGLAQVNSPFICQYLDNGVVDEQPYLAMELVDGVTLQDYVAERGPLTELQILELLEGLGQALQVLQREGLVHRDIKPANVILRDANTARPVLADFGLVRPASSDALTGAHMVMGSPGYLPPEYLLGDDYDRRGDLFALGMVARFAFTGEHYKQGLPTFKLLTDMTENDIPRLRQASPPLALLVQQLTRRDPKARLQLARILLQRLDQIRNGPCADCLRAPVVPCAVAAAPIPEDCPRGSELSERPKRTSRRLRRVC